MEETSLLDGLARLIRAQRVAALGTLMDGAPYVSLMPYAVAADLGWFYLHASRIAQHTQNLLQDRRVSLLIAEPDAGARGPQTLARVTIRGEAVEVLPTDLGHAEAKQQYLERFPNAALEFQLGDFKLYRVRPGTARYVAGFGRIHDLTFEDFEAAGAIEER